MSKKFSDEQLYDAKHISISRMLENEGESVTKEGEWNVWNGCRIKQGFFKNFYTGEEGSAVDFFEKHYNKGFVETVKILNNYSYLVNLEPVTESKNKDFHLPKRAEDSSIAKNYLIFSRKIDETILEEFWNKELIYGSNYYAFQNVVFVGLDKNNCPCHAQIRGTRKNVYRINVSGSDSKYTFNWVGKNDTLYVFEAPIDMLSYISINPKDWDENSYLAACGVSDIPTLQFLNDYSNIKKVYLCLDNDETGKEASKNQREKLIEKGYEVEILIPKNKDWNDDLCDFKRKW